MYQVHDWARVRELVRQGVPKQRIADGSAAAARRSTVWPLSRSRHTTSGAPQSSQLDPFSDAIAAMLRDDETAPATVIRERLQAQGYSGGITILKDYLHELRPLYRQPRLPAHHLRPRRDPAGRLVGHGRRRAGRQGRELAAPTASLRRLPFSAAHAVVFTHSQTTADAVPALLGCLTRLGGVPAKLVMDRDSSLVVRGRRAVSGRRASRPARGALHGPHRAAAALATEQGKRGAHQRLPRDLVPAAAQLPRPRRPAGPARRLGRERRLGSPPAPPRRPREARPWPWSAPSWLPCPIPCRRSTAASRCAPRRDGFARVAGVDYSLPPGYGLRRLQAHLSLHRADGLLRGPRDRPSSRAATCPATWCATLSTCGPCARPRRRSTVSATVSRSCPPVDLARYDALVGAPL